MSLVRVYGPGNDNGSFARVARGWVGGLRELGLLAGFYRYDDCETDLSGDDAPVGVFVGPPAMWPLLVQEGSHRCRMAVVAPNSTWLPARLPEYCERNQIDYLLPTSEWGHGVMSQHVKEVKLHTVPHGVAAALYQKGEIHHLDNTRDGFRVLHVTSSARQRKATDLLVEAWRKCRFEPGSRLTIVSDHRCVADPTETVELLGRLDYGELQMAGFYRGFHLVAQPSRAEGFGMVPLEASAAGVPVLLTADTGHQEYCDDLEGSCVRVPTHQYGASDDGPGAQAPTVLVDDIAQALTVAHRHYRDLKQRALHNAQAVAGRWNWPNMLLRSGVIQVIQQYRGY